MQQHAKNIAKLMSFITQALVNAHNNAKYTPLRASTTGLVFFGTPHDGGNKTLVALGSAAARVASTLHLQASNDIIETLKSGSLFTDLLGEQWRHQLESYQLVSFWEGIGNVVPKKSATFGLPGERENIIELNAEHSELCRFDSDRRDQDNFKLVANNIQDLYEAALATSESVDVFFQSGASRETADSPQGIDQNLNKRFASLSAPS